MVLAIRARSDPWAWLIIGHAGRLFVVVRFTMGGSLSSISSSIQRSLRAPPQPTRAEPESRPPVREPVARERERRWLVIYDGDCGFCKLLLSGLLRFDRGLDLQPIALQRPEAGDLLADLSPAERMGSWHLISPTGERRSGGAAIPSLLRLLPAGRPAAAVFARFPKLTDCGYRWVAEHRSRLSKLVPTRAKQHASARVREREQALAGQRPLDSARR